MHKIDKKILEQIDKTVTTLYYNDGMLDLDLLCKDLGVKVYDAEFENDGTSGVLLHEGDEWSIFVNRKHSLNRKRFTIAHELGHFFVHKFTGKAPKSYKSGGVITDNWIAYRKKKKLTPEERALETEANAIAAHILMPEDSVRQLVEEKKSPETISSLFGVSETALIFRLKDLEYLPLELI